MLTADQGIFYVLCPLKQDKIEQDNDQKTGFD